MSSRRRIDTSSDSRPRRLLNAALVAILLCLLAAVWSGTASATTGSAVSYSGRDGNVYRYDVATATTQSLGVTARSKVYWSPNGHYAVCIAAGRVDEAYNYVDVGVYDRWSGSETVIKDEAGVAFPHDPGNVRFGGWSADSRRFALVIQSWRDGEPSTALYAFTAATARALCRVPCTLGAAAISPDGARVVYSSGGEQAESLWMLDVESGRTSLWMDYSVFSGHADGAVRPYWPPKGSRLALEVAPPAYDAFWRRHFFLALVDLSSKAVRYLDAESGGIYDVSDDGRFILVESQPWDAIIGQYAMDLIDTETNTARRLLPPDGTYDSIASAQLSPDSSKAVFDVWRWAPESWNWRFEVYLMDVTSPTPAKIGEGKCPTWIPATWPAPSPAAGRADLVAALKDLRKDVKAAENRMVQRTAMALAVVSIDRAVAKRFNWLAFFWKAIRSSSQTVLALAGTFIDMGAEDFVRGRATADPALVRAGLEKYSAWAAENAGEMGAIKAFLFTNGLLGNWRDLHDYELFCDGYHELSLTADKWRKRYGSDDFSRIFGAMTGEVAGSDYLTVPLRSGPPGPTGVPTAKAFARCPNRLLTALQKRCDEALASLPAELPADLDVDALVAEVDRVRASVRKLGIHAVSYPAAYRTAGGWVRERRKTKLGLLDDEYELLKDLEDCFTAKIDVQTWETIQGGADWAVSWGSFYFTATGHPIAELIGSLELGADVYLTGEATMAPQTDLAPMAAMNQLEAKMLIDTKEELARLYQVTAGLLGYVQSRVTPTPADGVLTRGRW